MKIYDFTESEKNSFKNEFNNIIATAKEKSSAVQIKGKYVGFCPYLQYITFDALKTEDYPNGIERNSAYVCFEVDLCNKKVSLHSTGSVWLSPKDKAEDSPYRYYAMRSMMDIAFKDYGVKKFRKQGYKTADDLYKKMETYFKAVMDAITKYTGGYPYKQGIAD